MADFEKSFPNLLKHEGGFTNHPNDPGGDTNKGITMKTFRYVAEKLLGIEPTLENLKALTDEQAKEIYRAEYWDKIKGDEIQLHELADIVFDFYVNAGFQAVKMLQKIINSMSMGEKISVDGVMGIYTLTALNKLNQKEVYRRYRTERVIYYNEIARENPKMKVFLEGWLNRVSSFPVI